MIRTIFTTERPVGDRVVEIPEKEAVAKLCCGPQGCGIIKETPEITGRYCVGSMCMAWRWGVGMVEVTMWMFTDHPVGRHVREAFVDGELRAFGLPLPPIENFRPEGEGWQLNCMTNEPRQVRWERPAGQRGYCAWAGKNDAQGRSLR